MAAKAHANRRLLGYLRPYWQQTVVAYLSMGLATLINLFVPQIIAEAIDSGLAQRKAQLLFYAGGVFLAIAVGRGLVSFGQRFYGEWLSNRIAYDLRNQFYRRLQQLPFAFHDRAKTGDLMSRATSDITESERFAGIGLMDLLSVLMLLIGVVVAMLLEHVWLTLLVLPVMATLVLTALYFGTTMRPMFKRIQ